MDDVTPRTPPAPLRWWLVLVFVLATATLLTMGRHSSARATDVQPVSTAPPPASPLTDVRAI